MSDTLSTAGLTIDIGPALAALDRLDQRMGTTAANADRAAGQTKTAFSAGATGLTAFEEKALAAQNATLKLAGGADKLQQSMVRMQQSASGAGANAMFNQIKDLDPFQKATMGSGTFGRTLVQTSAHAEEHALALGRITHAAEGLAVEFTGVNGHLALIGGKLAEFGVGGAITLGVIAGIAVIGYAWDKLTESTRKANEEAAKAHDFAERLRGGPFKEQEDAIGAIAAKKDQANATIANLDSPIGRAAMAADRLLATLNGLPTEMLDTNKAIQAQRDLITGYDRDIKKIGEDMGKVHADEQKGFDDAAKSAERERKAIEDKNASEQHAIDMASLALAHTRAITAAAGDNALSLELLAIKWQLLDKELQNATGHSPATTKALNAIAEQAANVARDTAMANEALKIMNDLQAKVQASPTGLNPADRSGTYAAKGLNGELFSGLAGTFNWAQDQLHSMTSSIYTDAMHVGAFTKQIIGDVESFGASMFESLAANGIHSFGDIWGSFKSIAVRTFGELASMKLMESILSPAKQLSVGIDSGITGSTAAVAAGIPGWGLAVAGMVLAGTTLFGAGKANAEAAQQLKDAATAIHLQAVGQTSIEKALADLKEQFKPFASHEVTVGSGATGFTKMTAPDDPKVKADYDAARARIASDFFAGIDTSLNALKGPEGAWQNAMMDAAKQYQENTTNAIALGASTGDLNKVSELYRETIDQINAAEKARVQAIDDGLSVRMLATKGDDDATKALQRQIDERKEMAQAIQDGWTDEQKQLLVQVEASEDAATAAATLAQHLKDTADAAEALTRSTESLMTRFYRAVNDASAADTYAQQASHRQELSGITDPYTLYLTKYVQAAEDAQLKATQEAKAQTDALTAQTGILQDSLNVQQQQLTALQQVATSLATYASGLSTSSLSPLSPTDLLEATRSTRDSLYQRAMAGDQTAASQYGGADTAFLTQDRSYNASNSTYANDFKESQRRADELAALYGTKATAEQQMVQLLTDQLATAKQQLEAIGQVNTSIVKTPPPLTQAEFDALNDHMMENIRRQWVTVGDAAPQGGDMVFGSGSTVDFSPVTTAQDRTTTAVQEAGAAIVGTTDEGNAALVAVLNAIAAKLDTLIDAGNVPDTRVSL